MMMSAIASMRNSSRWARRIFKPSLQSRKSLRYCLPVLQARQLAAGQEGEWKQKFLERLVQSLAEQEHVRKDLNDAHKERRFTDEERDFIKDKLLMLDRNNIETSVKELDLPDYLLETEADEIATTAPTEDEEEVDVDTFVHYLVEKVYSFVKKKKGVQLKDFVLIFSPKAKEGSQAKNFHLSPKEYEDAAAAIEFITNEKKFRDVKQNLDFIQVMGFKNGEFSPPLFETMVDVCFGDLGGDTKELERILLSSCTPIREGDFDISRDKGTSKITSGKRTNDESTKEEDKSTEEEDESKSSSSNIKADLKYVDVVGDQFFVQADQQPDKKFAIVVTGESGSGKSMYSIGKAYQQGYLPVYAAISSAPSTLTEEVQKKPKPKYTSLSTFLGLVISCFCEVHERREGADGLYALKGKLNQERDAWATRVLDAAMREAVLGENVGLMWLDGNWNKMTLPDKVAVIIDEATDVDLAEGLVASVRTNTLRFERRLAKDKVQLFIVGTGLDAIRSTGRVGTNPALSELIYLKNPDMKTLVKKGQVSETQLAAINEGIFSRVLKTNARMFFQGVYPIMSLPVLTDDGPKMEKEMYEERLRNRLVKVASFQPIMDYAARLFVSQNSVNEFAEGKRNGLLKNAFLYHLKCAVEEVNCDEVKRRESEQIPAFDVDEDIFTRGLASRDGTSSALKYLACFGLTCEVRPGYGGEFEELTALHVLRVMESDGFEVFRCQLKYAWPPASVKGDIRPQIEKLRAVVLPEQEDEVSFERISGNATRYCIVFNQGDPNAQSGDLFVLKVDGTEAKLDTIQCKNHKKHPLEKAEIASWWNSLGVAIGTEDTEPVEEKAGYSYCGLEAFCKLASRRLKMDVQIDSRIMAVSYECPATFQLPKDKKLRWWFREMLEPTISVITPDTRDD